MHANTMRERLRIVLGVTLGVVTAACGAQPNEPAPAAAVETPAPTPSPNTSAPIVVPQSTQAESHEGTDHPQQPTANDNEGCAFEGAVDFSDWPTEMLEPDVRAHGDQLVLIVRNAETDEEGVGGCVSSSVFGAGLSAVLVHRLGRQVRVLAWTGTGTELKAFSWLSLGETLPSRDPEISVSVSSVAELVEGSGESPSEAQLIGLVNEAFRDGTTSTAVVAADAFVV